MLLFPSAKNVLCRENDGGIIQRNDRKIHWRINAHNTFTRVLYGCACKKKAITYLLQNNIDQLKNEYVFQIDVLLDLFWIMLFFKLVMKKWDRMRNHFSAGIVFRRQILTSIDVRIWRVKSIPARKELKYV